LIRGVTAFPSDGTVVIAGSGTGNFVIEYQIDLDDGNGWSTLATLNHTNLSAHTIDPDIGVRFRVKISHASGSTSDYLNRLNWSTTVDYDTYKYPEELVDITLQNIKDGSEYWIKNVDSNKVLDSGTQSGTNDILIENVPYNGSDETLLVRVRKSSDCPKYKPLETNATLTENGANVYISQIPDNLVCEF
jgi:hypothetical protein